MIRNLTKRNAAKQILRERLEGATGPELFERLAPVLECERCAPFCESALGRALDEACDLILDTIKCENAEKRPDAAPEIAPETVGGPR